MGARFDQVRKTAKNIFRYKKIAMLFISRLLLRFLESLAAERNGTEVVVFMDIGANIGAHALAIASRCTHNHHFFAI